MNRTAEPAVGEAWAYRARRRDPPVEVVVVRIGVRKPRRLAMRDRRSAYSASPCPSSPGTKIEWISA